jgi:hypothetical protein
MTVKVTWLATLQGDLYEAAALAEAWTAVPLSEGLQTTPIQGPHKASASKQSTFIFFLSPKAAAFSDHAACNRAAGRASQGHNGSSTGSKAQHCIWCATAIVGLGPGLSTSKSCLGEYESAC